jgi:hypothetical protein
MKLVSQEYRDLLQYPLGRVSGCPDGPVMKFLQKSHRVRKPGSGVKQGAKPGETVQWITEIKGIGTAMGLEERPIGQEEELSISIPHIEGFNRKFGRNMAALGPFQRDRCSPVINP